MLQTIRKTPARLSRRELLALGGAGLMSCTVPTLYAGRATRGQAALRLPVPPPEVLGNDHHVLTLAWSPDEATLKMTLHDSGAPVGICHSERSEESRPLTDPSLRSG